MQSAVSEATGFVHYARAARFFPLVRFGIKVSEPVRQSGRGRGSPCWIRGGAACMERRRGVACMGEGRRAMEAGLRKPLLPPCKAQPEGDAGERARGAACMGGEAGRGHAWRGRRGKTDAGNIERSVVSFY